MHVILSEVSKSYSYARNAAAMLTDNNPQQIKHILKFHSR